MRLTFQRKALLITAAALLGWLAALYIVSSHIVMGRFARLERESVILNVERARAALSAQLDALDSKTGDWANWDDAYAFVHGDNPEFISKNVASATFVQLKVDLIAFVDTSNQVVFAKAYNDKKQQDFEFPKALLEHLSHTDVLVQHTDLKSHHSGLVLVPDTALLVATRPILNTHGEGPIRGTLLFGSLLEREDILSLGQTTHTTLDFYRVSVSDLPADVAAASRDLAKQGDVVRPLDSDVVAGYTTINDIYGTPALALRLEMPREIYAQGRLTMNYFLVALLVVSVLFGVVAQVLLQRVVFHQLARKESEKRYRAIVEQATEGILLAEAGSHRVLETNASFQKLLGYGPNELPSLTLRDVHLRDNAGDERSLESLLSNAVPYSGEQEVRRKDGTWAYVELNANRVSSGASEIFCTVFHDISKRRKAEQELLLRERAIEAIEQGIVISDPNQPDNPVVYVNAAFEKLTGYSRDEAVGRNCRFLKGPETDSAALDMIRTAVRDRRPCLVQLVNYRKDGTKFWNSLIVSPVFDAKGQLTYFVGAQTDITPVKKLEEQLRQSQKMEAVGRLAGGVAHDFNNILTAMIGYCELARDQVDVDHPIRASIEEIAAAAERAASLTRQLLAFSRKQTLQPEVLDLNAIVGKMDKLLCRLLGEDIELVTKLAPNLGRVKADPGQIEQVLMNLSVNARDAMPTGGKLIVETANVTLPEEDAQLPEDVKPGDYAMIAVTDTGSGMTAEVKARIFEPFFTTKPQGQGTGLGLATCFGIVKQSGGHITVHTEPGHGTMFCVYLPRIRAELPTAAIAPVAPAPTGGLETIVLVEDDVAVRKLNARLLRSKGYNVIEASNGQEALQVASQESNDGIALLLTDVVMPEMGGKELAQRFRITYPHTKVLFCSGYTQEAIDRGGELEPGTAFLQKPFTPSILASKIREVLET